MNKKFITKAFAIVIAISFVLSNSAMLVPQKAGASDNGDDDWEDVSGCYYDENVGSWFVDQEKEYEKNVCERKCPTIQFEAFECGNGYSYNESDGKCHHKNKDPLDPNQKFGPIDVEYEEKGNSPFCHRPTPNNDSLPDWVKNEYTTQLNQKEGFIEDCKMVTQIDQRRIPCEPNNDDQKATLTATKIICKNESDLPDWGVNPGGADITSAIINNFLTTENQDCSIDSNWKFQWALDGVTKPDNNDDELDPPWNTFIGSTQIPVGTKIWVREVFEDGYIPFFGTESSEPQVSAEFYCHTDVWKYDNYEWLDPVEADGDYYCVAFNVLEESKPVCGNGKKEGDEECDGEDDVDPSKNFCSTSCHLIPIYNGGNSCPSGTEATLIDSYPINSKDLDGETIVLADDKTYLFTASGTFVSSSCPYKSDAGYTTINDWVDNGSTEFGIQGTPPDYAAHALLGNLGLGVGVINWGDYNSSHEYNFSYTIPVGFTNTQFVIGDRYGDWFGTEWDDQAGREDNEGSLNLDVYECVPEIGPYCGDGKIDSGEECDGEDGVTEGENFCTNTCKLIPIYNGNHVCPDGTQPEESPIQSINILSTDIDGEVVNLNAGTYLFKASGQYQFGTSDVRKADAGYGTEDNWANLRQDLGILKGAEHRGVLSLLSDMGTGIMGIVNWGEYNESHEYQKAYTFNETKDVTFVISDWYDGWYDNSSSNNQKAMSDNSGELNLDVYKCVASENGNEENGTTTTTIVTTNSGPTGAPIGGQFAPLEGIVLGESVTRGEEGIVAGAYCEPYLHEYIKYGANNNPVEVKKLQSFLNEYLGISLALSGVYDEQTYNAVKQFQLLMKHDILAPWVDNGCLPAEDIATGYVYRTTKWAINNMFCPTPRPDVSDEKCYLGEYIGLGDGLDGQILGESIVLGEEILLDSTENEEPLDSSEEELIEEAEEIEETEETPAQGILVTLLVVLGLGGLAYVVFRGRIT